MFAGMIVKIICELPAGALWSKIDGMNRNDRQNAPLLKKLGGHISTVHMHRALVRKHCFACGLYYQGLTHDLSKYSWPEFSASVRYYQGDRSPFSYEKTIRSYSSGWLHHKGKNRHHWEYWYDMIGGKWQPIEMPYEYVVEMVCDRIAACKTYQKEKYTQQSALLYYLEKPAKNYMHENTRKLLEYLLRLVAEKGEDEAFRMIRESIVNKHPLSPE